MCTAIIISQFAFGSINICNYICIYIYIGDAITNESTKQNKLSDICLITSSTSISILLLIICILPCLLCCIYNRLKNRHERTLGDNHNTEMTIPNDAYYEELQDEDTQES